MLLVAMSQVLDRTAIAQAIDSVAGRIAECHRQTDELGIVGIANGGIFLGQRLAVRLQQLLGREIPCGSLNAQFHRDDIGHKPIPKAFMRTDIPFSIDGATIILADDVLFSGRTTRAALNELFDHGRPARVELAALCDRGGRRLPIQADYIGIKLNALPHQRVVVNLGKGEGDSDSIIIEDGVNSAL